jgi:hypothetical protein
MKKLILLLIVLCSYSSFAQLEGVPVSGVIALKNEDISPSGIYVTPGKVWKLTTYSNITAYYPNGQVVDDSYSNVFFTEGYSFRFNNDFGHRYIFNAVIYDLDAQQLSHAAPKIDDRPTLFPNPTNSMLSLNSDKNYKIQVFDLNGRKLMEQNGNSLNMEHLSNATYVVKAMDVDTKEMLSYKVVKE